MVHERIIFPVGQGGFAGERIGNFVVVYDCGSLKSSSMLERSIDIASREVDHVDVLFISHFDNDHVNGLRYLLSSVKIIRAVIPYIPDELRVAYSVYTSGAYTITLGLLNEMDIEVTRVGAEDEEYMRQDAQHVWEWVAKSMMTKAEFNIIKAYMQKKLIDVAKLENDIDYLESNKKNINAIFKDVFGAKGPNAKGLIMLSQRCQNSPLGKSFVTKGWCCCCSKIIRHHKILGVGNFEETSCLYVGDADLKSKVNNKMVQDFLTYHRTGTTLLLMQIPHHGSHNNIGDQFETEFSSKYYFVNDVDTKRLQQSVNLFKSLQRQKKLLVSRELCQDVILTRTIM